MRAETEGREVGRRRRAARLLNDDRLADRAARGDRRALEEICVRYRQDLYRFCLTLLGDPQDAQDAVQNALVKMLRALPGERRKIRLRPWLYRIARNEAVELVRRRRAVSEGDAEAVPSTVEIADSVEERERLRSLLDDLGRLPERQRSALMMRELAGLGFGEIAAALEASEGAVRQSIYEARLGLREMESGREMSCEAVKRALSDADGRVARRRDLRAHLRACPDCRAFRDGMARRRSDLAAISPLPAAASAALLQGVIGAGAAGSGSAAGAAAGGAGAAAGGAGAAAGGAGAAAGSTAGALIAKSAATVAVVALVGGSAADRTGLIDVPTPGEGGTEQRAVAPASATGPLRRADDAAPAGARTVTPQGRGSAARAGAAPGSPAGRRAREAPGRGARARGRGAAPGERGAGAAQRGVPGRGAARGRPDWAGERGRSANGAPSSRGPETSAARRASGGKGAASRGASGAPAGENLPSKPVPAPAPPRGPAASPPPQAQSPAAPAAAAEKPAPTQPDSP